MAVLTPQSILRTGLIPAFVAAAGGGDSFVNTNREFILIKNGGGGSIDVTLDLTATVDGISVTDPVVAIAAGAEKMIGPFTSVYEGAGRSVGWTYDGVVSVTVGVFKL